MDYEVECVRPRSSPKKSRSEVVERDGQVRQLLKEDAVQ